MAGEATSTGDHLSFHRLSAHGILALARGDGDGAVVAELLSAERSRRLLLLRALDVGLVGHGLPHLETAYAWALLERAERQAPEAFEQILMSPNTGMWVSLAVRRLRGRRYEDAPLWVVAGHLSALAAAAGARAGLDFAVTVPVRRGWVPLPTLGCAVLPVTDQWSTARIVGHAGALRVTGAHGEVEVAPGWDRRGPGWLPVRRLTLGAGRPAKSLVLEELDPYRTYPRPSDPRPLPDADAQWWETLLSEAWRVLLRDDPESARAMAEGLMSVAPTPMRERFRPHSSTTGDAFGGVTASRPDDVAQLAATLVHEFQHTKLGGVMHLRPLTHPAPDPEAPEELFYAPWRDDPRPLGGLLQGIYAFLGVTRFWRAHRNSAEGADASVAHFEFAMLRSQLRSTLNLVSGNERLTPLGRELLERLGERCESWMADEVPEPQRRLAEAAAADHRARWGAYHLVPGAAAVDEAAAAWRRGDAHPPTTLAAAPDLVPDTAARLLDGAAVLARHRLSDPDGNWRHAAARYCVGAGGVDGADEADILLVCGDRARARDAYSALLVGKGAPPHAWAGLGAALAGDESDGRCHHPIPDDMRQAASDLLLRHPERARAVQDVLTAATGRGADPLRLAAWLGGIGSTMP